MFIHTVTIYNKYVDNKVEKWQRKALPGVFWDATKGATVRKTGVTSADSVQLIIPMRFAGYVRPKTWAAMPDKSEAWTIQSGDVVILGAVDYEVVKSSAELREYDDMITVTSVDSKMFGGSMSHLEVSGR